MPDFIFHFLYYISYECSGVCFRFGPFYFSYRFGFKNPPPKNFSVPFHQGVNFSCYQQSRQLHGIGHFVASAAAFIATAMTVYGGEGVNVSSLLLSFPNLFPVFPIVRTHSFERGRQFAHISLQQHSLRYRRTGKPESMQNSPKHP